MGFQLFESSRWQKKEIRIRIRIRGFYFRIMILSDRDIRKLLKEGTLKIKPLRSSQIQPASIDLRLGENFLILKEYQLDCIDVSQPVSYFKLTKKTITLPPKSFVLATTKEYIELPSNLTAFVEGRSSIGRLGLFIQNAGWVDPGFKGKITLELFNANSIPIKLRAGMRICQLVVARTTTPASSPYKGKYQGQKDVLGSKIHLDEEFKRDSK